RIAAALPVPFASSSLLQVPMVARVLPGGRRVGILTIDQSSLTADHLRAVGIDASTPVEGVPADGHLAQVFVDNTAELDVLEARRELVEAAKRLRALHAGVGAIVLECANMPPYASALHAELGVPVYDWYSMVCWFARGLQPRTFIASAALR
ncbi:MAG: aspartate/glutamate racemase family protein, partial [Betaproteobacteria bacterium]